MKNTSYTITAKLNAPEQGAEGVVITQGGRFAGWGLVVLDGNPVWAYKNTQQPNDGVRISGPDRLTPGDHVLTLDFAYDGGKGEVGKGGEYVLRVDGNEVARTRIDHTVPYIYSVDETLDVGEDRGTPIIEDYADRMPFKYNGRIREVDIDLKGGNARPPRSTNRTHERGRPFSNIAAAPRGSANGHRGMSRWSLNSI